MKQRENESIEEREDNNQNSGEEQEISDSEINRKGKRPKKDIGVFHHLMHMSWEKGEIENIHEKDDDVIYAYYSKCVSRSVGKRKWNKYSMHMLMENYVTCADEAFAMIVLENNIPKWTNELEDSTLQPSERRKTLYTEGENGGKKWTEEGMIRFVELCKKCKINRTGTEAKKERWLYIQNMVRERQIEEDRISQRKKKAKYTDDNEGEEDEEKRNETETMEMFLLSMANGSEVTNITNI